MTSLNNGKSPEYKMLIVLLIFFVLLTSVSFLSPVLNKIGDKKPQKQIISDTGFSNILDDAVKKLSEEREEKYIIDKQYYDEKAVMKYVSVMSGKALDKINKDDVAAYIDSIFIPVKGEKGISLIQKDNEALIFECVDKEKMNELDYALIGASNAEVLAASRGFYISQNDERFKDMPYGTSTVKISGCGPVTLTMALNYVSGQELVQLEDVLKWADENHMYRENEGTRWALMSSFPPTVGIDSEEIYISNTEQFEAAVTSGGVLIASMKKGNFTDNGHFILITKIENGKVSVLDPASICRSLKEWDIETVFGESNKSFWRISNK